MKSASKQQVQQRRSTLKIQKVCTVSLHGCFWLRKGFVVEELKKCEETLQLTFN
jgi:hypothetical protein